MKHSRILLLAVVAFLLIPLAFSQTLTTGDVVGIVTDTSGAVVPAAKITLTSVATNEVRTATTNQQGEYRFALIPAGEYELSAETAGLKSNRTRFTALVGQEQAMNL